MKNAGKKIWLNLSLWINVLIFIILSIIAFWSIGFSNGDVLGKGAAEVKSSYFWMGLFGIIFIIIAIAFPFVKIFSKSVTVKKIIDFSNLLLLTSGTCLMLAAQITFASNIADDRNYWKIIGAIALIVIGFIVTIQPQIKVLFYENKDKKDKQKPEDHKKSTNKNDETLEHVALSPDEPLVEKEEVSEINKS